MVLISARFAGPESSNNEANRVPRLEFLPEAAPAAEAALLQAGFVTEDRLAIMTSPRNCASCHHRQASASSSSREATRCSRRDSERGLWCAQAYGGRRRAPSAMVDAGAVAGLAQELTGSGVASGLVAAASNGFAELAAVGVLSGWRRREMPPR